MNLKKNLLVLLLASSLPNLLMAQVGYQKDYVFTIDGVEEQAYPMDVVTTSSGSISSFKSESNTVLLEADNNGTVLNTLTLNLAYNAPGRNSLIRNSDGSLFIVGVGATDNVEWLKTDISGTVQFHKTIDCVTLPIPELEPDPNPDPPIPGFACVQKVMDAIATEDGGYLILGKAKLYSAVKDHVADYSGNWESPFLLKLDAEGEVEWYGEYHNQFKGSKSYSGHCPQQVLQSPTGDFIVLDKLGAVANSGSENLVEVIKVAPNGTGLWNQPIHGQNNNDLVQLNAADFNSNGELIMALRRGIYKVDVSGAFTIVDSYSFDWDVFQFANWKHLNWVANDEVYLVGESSAGNGILLRFEDDFTMTFVREMDETNSIEAVKKTSNGQLIMAGLKNTGQNFPQVLKTDVIGRSGCQIDLPIESIEYSLDLKLPLGPDFLFLPEASDVVTSFPTLTIVETDLCCTYEVNMQGVTSICEENGSTTLYVNSPLGATISWDFPEGYTFNNSNLSAITANMPGTYAVRIEDENGGCVGLGVIEITTYPAVQFIQGVTPLGGPYCHNENPISLLNQISPTGGTWSGTGVTGNFFDPALSATWGNTTIEYAYIDQHGCRNVFPLEMEVELPISPYPGSVQTTYIQGQINGLLPGSGTWYLRADPNNIYVTDLPITYINPNWPLGTYLVDYCTVSANGCLNCSAYTFTMVPARLNVADLLAQPEAQFYPNPSQGSIRLTLPDQNSSASIQYSVSNVLGQVLINSQTAQLANGILDLDLNELAKGVYWVSILVEEQEIAKKIIIE